jgi:hypothetical protein
MCNEREINNNNFRERLHKENCYNPGGTEDGEFCDKMERHKQYN